MDIKQLEDLILQARKAYYNLDPIMSDSEYDALIDKLNSLNPKSDNITQVGYPIDRSVGGWKKQKHKIMMGSLNKVNLESEFVDWVGINSHSDLLITHKLDGSSLELVYFGGKLKSCVTRGDGIVGEDITPNGALIPTIPKTISYDGDLFVRGEVVIYKQTFNDIYGSQYSNPRNAANGKMKNYHDPSGCKHLTFVAYTIMGIDGVNYENQVFETLKGLGFVIPDYHVGDVKSVIEWHNKCMENRDSIPYMIDGTVIRINNMQVQRDMGDKNMRPVGQIAWKPESKSKTTEIVDVEWNVGSTGRITPVAIVKPVEIDGVTITRVSLHNIKMFKSLQLKKSDIVIVTRRNDVIPYLTKPQMEVQ